jgi:hypothetical protein
MRDRSRQTLEALVKKSPEAQLQDKLPPLSLGGQRLYVVGYSTPEGHDLHQSDFRILVVSTDSTDERFPFLEGSSVDFVVRRDRTVRPSLWTVLHAGDDGFAATSHAVEYLHV